MTKISYVEPDSLASDAGIEPGDYLVNVNGKEIKDVLEFRFVTADEEYQITIKKADGSYEVIDIINEYDEEFGVEFENPLMTKARSCANKCIFCFIDQMPSGMRETLYFKDDDSRLSFLQGNYITMTNLSDKDLNTIAEMKMSPINVSVQCTEPDLRISMLGNKKAGKLLEQLKVLADADIVINCQIVLCRNINDKEHLDRTIADLENFFPSVFSVSIVPVGLTKYRDGLYELDGFDKDSSIEVIEQISKWQEKFLEKYGKRTVYLADEFYIMAEKDFPEYEEYEEFPQLENGVGMIKAFEDEFIEGLSDTEEVYFKKCSVATGVLSEEFISGLVSKIKGIDCKVYAIKNEFFGERITVSGLVTGGDLINQLKNKELGDYLLISDNMLRNSTDVFLDDVTVPDVEKELNVKVLIVRSGCDFAEKLTKDLK